MYHCDLSIKAPNLSKLSLTLNQNNYIINHYKFVTLSFSPNITNDLCKNVYKHD